VGEKEACISGMRNIHPMSRKTRLFFVVLNTCGKVNAISGNHHAFSLPAVGLSSEAHHYFFHLNLRKIKHSKYEWGGGGGG
jgi:hypothetical protein